MSYLCTTRGRGLMWVVPIGSNMRVKVARSIVCYPGSSGVGEE